MYVDVCMYVIMYVCVVCLFLVLSCACSSRLFVACLFLCLLVVVSLSFVYLLVHCLFWLLARLFGVLTA